MNAQMQQMGQQLQMMQSQLQAAIKQIETEQVKQGAVLQKAQMDNEAKIRVAEIQAQGEMALKQISAQLEELKLALQHTHEASEAEKDRAHDGMMAIVEPALQPPEPPEPGEVPLATEGPEV
jgi:hypothetical protein